MMPHPASAMRRVIAATLLALAGSAMARPNWLLIGSDGGVDLYIDEASIERPAGHVKAWTMLSFDKRQKGGSLSEQRLFLFSCKDQMLEWQQSIHYAEPLGEGEFVQARSRLRAVAAERDASHGAAVLPEANFLHIFNSLC
ncbi:MAG TPA: surface-adhesin E family protein [Burkholderiaceae bacterium]|nr:surface-adhesin E family protein [Burkholderiaceae bacterium]